ncbi:hypothetical protein [Thioalkalivibrio sp. XN279]|jgi:hypothetical protein|uniref:hypothetical protein n=1 Tax=Thioalkalivibrio sp. XN279 TaxID=2714953 RepID=UPI00140B8DEF|nr:hypothetical protein [Thioalkalivibrio sp. XN279]NHA14277.1 hypothetical protein [Thioalkalivibrio sp. XN279]
MRFQVILASLFLVAFPPQSTATPVDQALQARTSDCVSNCASLVRIGKSHVVVAKDAAGEILRVISVDLPLDAKLVQSDQEVRQDGVQSMSSGATGGGTVETRTETYVTATEIIVVTYYFYFDANGNLVDVQTDTRRFPRGDTEQER